MARQSIQNMLAGEVVALLDKCRNEEELESTLRWRKWWWWEM